MPPHEVLGVAPDATAEEVTEAFRRFALRHHPDRGGDPGRFQDGLDAYRRMTGSGSARRRTPSRARDADVVFHRRARPGVASLLRLAGRRLAATRFHP
ncbi:MAG: DnaJ domain-containing protein [Acidimicrobiales bacterium]